MKHQVTERGGRTIVAFDGEIDLEQSPRARQVLLQAVGGGRPVLVDMSHVSYIDSSGVASLVEAFQRARQRQTGFALVAVSAAALRVLQLARLDRVFTIHERLEEGLGDGD
jgi:anti-sigma B factor antagonist